MSAAINVVRPKVAAAPLLSKHHLFSRPPLRLFSALRFLNHSPSTVGRDLLLPYSAHSRLCSINARTVGMRSAPTTYDLELFSQEELDVDIRLEEEDDGDEEEVEEASNEVLDVVDGEDAVCFWIAMPGYGKEHVRVTAEERANVVTIRGESEGEVGEERKWSYCRMLDLGAGSFEKEKMKAEVKNGVLKLMVPKIKEDERKDVIHVAVE